MKKEVYSQPDHWTLWEEGARRQNNADRYCSSPFWAVPLMLAFQPRGRLWVYRDGQDLAVFHELDVPGGRLVLPPDGMWTLGLPILADEPTVFLERLCSFWATEAGPQLRQISVSGLYAENPLWNLRFRGRREHWELPPAGRQVASLDGGSDGYLSRRSVNFRSRLRRTVKKALSQGVSPEMMPDHSDQVSSLHLLERAMRIEAQSWKGKAGQGVDRGEMAAFYQHMFPLLAAHGRLRGLFLTRDGRDLAYLFGAVFGDYFRGLQFSYLDDEDQGLGNVAQWMMIQRLVEEGCRDYDLGQAMDYKTRWAESTIPSYGFAFQLLT